LKETQRTPQRWFFFFAAVGQVIAVGQAAETDLAQAIAWAPKARLVAQSSETDSAQAVTPRKSSAIGQVLENDLAQSVTWSPKHRLVGMVSETDQAQMVIHAQLIPFDGIIRAIQFTTKQSSIGSVTAKQSAALTPSSAQSGTSGHGAKQPGVVETDSKSSAADSFEGDN